MTPKILKTTISRKPYRNLSDGQKRRISNEIRAHLHYLRNRTAAPANVDTVQDISSSVHNLNIQNLQDMPSTSSFSIPSRDDTARNSADTVIEQSFRDRLASCFVDINITHSQGNKLLSLLRTHSCLRDLPRDIRTLIGTPRGRAITSVVSSGLYIHFDVESKIVQYLLKSAKTIPDRLQLDFHVDGCTLDRASTIQLWPIQIRIVNIKNSRPIIVGIYKGEHKPEDPVAYLEQFVADINSIMSNGGIVLEGRTIPIVLRCFIADAPARALILNHKAHTSWQPCSKCKVRGKRVENRMVFPGVEHELRTDDDYAQILDKEHHKEGHSPLASLHMKMVSQVPFDYMHLVLQGVTKKVISALICGTYSRAVKLSSRHIRKINERMKLMYEYCPSDFVRRPRPLTLFTKFKATELRQFLLYTGPVVMYELLNNEALYTHFLLLHSAIRILTSAALVKTYSQFARIALKQFVNSCEFHYGPTFPSYNVHGLLHLADDVDKYGVLDSYSAFAYENNMMFFRTKYRKPEKPLSQLAKRITEDERHGTSEKK
ncbi:uncharacterized protein LOC143219570 [Lasioglossum baleicum]|uniref:uncharacterized protein LOC143219570 n=1 Tax=Lasioglossum baleicum TaxID=434251 RepID=UPI003FCD708C